MPESNTTVVRAQVARRTEDLVIAEASLEGERLVSVMRFMMFGLLSASQIARALDVGFHPDPPRTAGVVLYLLFTVGNMVAIRRVKPNPRRANSAIWVTLVDLAFFAWMGFRSYQIERSVDPEVYAAGLAMPILFTVSRYSAWQPAVATLLSSVIYVAFAAFCHVGTLHGAAFVVACYIILGVVVGSAGARVRELFSSLRKRENLQRFVAPEVAGQLLEFGEAALAPTQREVTLLFSDIRDFTALSEKMDPRALLQLLDGYFCDMSGIVHGYQGSVNKFIGDGMLAIWGAPERKDDHAALALKAALAMRQKVQELNGVRRARGEPELRIGIGVHTGTVAAGMLGGADQHEYTVIGDAVNVASRIEGLNKEHNTDILVSEATWTRAGARFDGELRGESKVKGREEPVRVYALRAVRTGPASALDAADLAASQRLG